MLLGTAVLVASLASHQPPPPAAAAAPPPPAVAHLRRLSVEYRQLPLAIGVPTPTFSWEIWAPTERGVVQGDFTLAVWKAGTSPAGSSAARRVEASNRSTFVPLPDGLTLESDTEYAWSVEIPQLRLSANSTFSTGLLAPSDWNASEWIVAETGWSATQMRKDFTLPAGRLQRARLFAAIPGYGQVLLNGQHVDGEAGTRTMTQFDQSVRYFTFDVTSLLSVGGANTLGLHLGGGAYKRYNYGPPAARLLLRATMEPSSSSSSSSTFELGTDGSWTQHPGPYLANDEFQGVIYDANRETPGWTSPGYLASQPAVEANWTPVLLGAASATVPGVNFKLAQTKLLAAEAPAVAVMHRLAPLQMTSPTADVVVFDFAQNIAGWCKLRVTGQHGARIQLRHAEILNHEPYATHSGQYTLIASRAK